MEKSYIMVPTSEFEELVRKVNEIHEILTNKNEGLTTSGVNGFVTEDEAVKIINKSKTWLWRKRTDGELPYKKLGSKTYYFKDDLLNLLKDI